MKNCGTCNDRFSVNCNSKCLNFCEENLIDMVNHPPHYKSDSGLESIDVITAFNLDFYLGNAVKYILRAGKKDKTKEIEDLQKSVWYLTKKIQLLTKE